ncbi:hypothetical protein E4T47_08674 [Aureobasidium subglaciale]|nr:hypothetical protein E4T47_08674 [Aureobasidium subglaciale]
MFFAILRSHTIQAQRSQIDMDYEKKNIASPSESMSPNAEIGTVVDIGDEGTRNFYGNSISDSYRMKSEIVNQCIEEIGIGRYQWELFVVSGFGWITDNFWSQGIGSIQPSVALEFAGVTNITLSSVAYYAGLIFGAFFWGISADLIGRKPAFNATLIIGGLFGTAVTGLNNFTAFCIFWTIIGTAAGGNVPVDSIIFLEFVPSSHQYLLTALSSWRYTMITLSAMTLVFAFIRIAVFKMPESPRYLISKGRDAEAVEAVNYVARRNGKSEPLTLAMLQEVDRVTGGEVKAGATTKLSRNAIIKENLKDFESINYKNLFANAQLARHTKISVSTPYKQAAKHFLTYAEYAIMYAFTPESFPAPHRGTATGTAATLLRIGGLCASLIGTYTEFSVVPIYVSASLWIVVGLIAFALPFETHGRAAI